MSGDTPRGTGLELLTVEEMEEADRAAIASGISGESLMENAGAAVADFIRQNWEPCPTLILCGPGNNGGDGFVAARHLADKGWPVRIALAGDRAALQGDAAIHAGKWQGPVETLGRESLGDAELVVDALFGAGLSRPLEGAAAELVSRTNDSGIRVVAVDIPSGVSGNSGAALGGLAMRATATVTFFRAKPGHFLLPGRELVGELHLADIGIPEAVLEAIGPRTWLNGAPLWQGLIPERLPGAHKYSFGHVLIAAGDTVTGAARLSARAALRAGAGLVTLAGPRQSHPILALAGASVILAALGNEADWARLLKDRRINCLLLGPGLGLGSTTRKRVLAALDTAERMGRSLVLDADALTSFEKEADRLFAAIKAPLVMTPHEGEFKRLFPDLSGDRPERAKAAAARSGAVVLLKGYDSVIAAPDGRAAINANAPPDLATAGSGDVLAGMVAAFIAQGLPAFEAACAACWLHGAAASAFGRGLIAEDLPEMLPPVLQELQAGREEP